jgi:hypothetical protein
MSEWAGVEFRPRTFLRHLTNHRPPDVLFHYTDQSGLLGIVKCSKLYATDVRYMNDPTEFRLALGLAESQLKCTKCNSQNQKDFVKILSKVPEQMKDINLFSVSFCAYDDLLSQWRGYSGGSYGYAIGFRYEKLIASTNTNDGNFLLGQCIYRRATQVSIVKEIVEHCLREVDQNRPGMPPLRMVFAFLLYKYGIFFKNEKFRGEAEWRLVPPPDINSTNPAIGFRKGQSMITPYYRVPIGAKDVSAIQCVRIGPCPHPDLSERSVRELLRANEIGGESPPVCRSCIPFRNW